ncbi:MAG: alginate export family protein, partial [Planctomycetota bacterium]
MTRSSTRLLLTAGLILLAPSPAVAQTTDGRWNLDDALETPDWLHVGGSFVTRFESLGERLAAGATGNDRGLFTRLLLEVGIRDTFTEVFAELIDSRLSNEAPGSVATFRRVDALELLQGYAAFRFTDAFADDDQLRVLVGRHTMDVGSRRFIARNRYRNTINSFLGVNATWKGAGGSTARAFYTLPTRILPRDSDTLLDGTPRNNEESRAVRFYGAVFETPDVGLASRGEFYALGLFETDRPDVATRNRRLTTLGTRIFRKPEVDAFHWEFESALQFGTSRASASAAEDLDHEAWFQHAHAGYTFGGPHELRAELLFDVASGDRDGGDGDNNRFDSLFGVPRFEYGATGFFRPIARANILSPGVRFFANVGARGRLSLIHRLGYVASRSDRSSNGLTDPTGGAGRHIGDLTEVVWKQPIGDGSTNLEFGLAYFSEGGFTESAPESVGPGHAWFGYAQV